jgi:hypothetical protein
MLLLNIDFRTNKARLHKDECGYAKRRTETPLKGLESSKRDGGWFSCISPKNVERRLAQENNEQGGAAKLLLCNVCKPKFSK